MPDIEKTSLVVALDFRQQTGLTGCETDGSDRSGLSDARFHFFCLSYFLKS
jgi:hypothetical protein